MTPPVTPPRMGEAVPPPGAVPPVTPPSMGESLPKSMGEPLHYPHSIPLAGAPPRDGAYGAAHVSGGWRC